MENVAHFALKLGVKGNTLVTNYALQIFFVSIRYHTTLQTVKIYIFFITLLLNF